MGKKNARSPEFNMPPQAVDIEQIVLGAIMLEKDAIELVRDLLEIKTFYKPAHELIYEAIVRLNKKGEPLDIITVTEELRKMNKLEEAGGPFYVTTLTSRVASAGHIEYHARILLQKFIQRRYTEIAQEILKRGYDETTDVEDLINYAEKELYAIAEQSIKKDAYDLDWVIDKTMKQIEEASKNKEDFNGVSTGFSKLDRITSGWQKSDLVILAARPSMGKTAFSLSMVKNISIDMDIPVLFFSLEMSAVQLASRIIVSESEIDAKKIRNGNLKKPEWEQLEYTISKFDGKPLFIDETPAISLSELRAKCRRFKNKHDIKLVVIDYLQLMTTGESTNKFNREQEVSTISKGLKSLAKELEIPVIALSQLNRLVVNRSGHRPQLSDLRESGSIEQDADIVMFIHRPEMLGIHADEEGNPTIGLAELIIAKHRNGEVTDVELRFINHLAKFTDLPTELDDLDNLFEDNAE